MSRSSLALAVLVAVLVGCGEEGSEGGAKPRTAGGEPATTTEPAEPAKTREASPASSDRECADLWNTAVDPLHTERTAATVFVQTKRVRLVYSEGHCFVFAPINRRRTAVLWAEDGKGPYRLAERHRVPRGKALRFNARAGYDAWIELDGD
jgi:hypothetical protein